MQYDQPTNQPTGQNHPFHGTMEGSGGGGGRGGRRSVDGWLSVCKLVCPFPPGQENKWIAQSTRLSDARRSLAHNLSFFLFASRGYRGTSSRVDIAINRHSHSNTQAKNKRMVFKRTVQRTWYYRRRARPTDRSLDSLHHWSRFVSGQN
jgi:hypothetical protein